VSVKTAAARLFGLTESDIFFLKSMRHSWWLWKIHKLPLGRFEFPPLPPVDEVDRALADRIITFYHHASKGDGDGERSPMWDRTIARFQAPLVEALCRRDTEGLATLLRGFLRSGLVRGIDAGDAYREGNWRVHSLKLLDGLVSLAEQVGAARAESSHGRSAQALDRGMGPLVEAIEDRLGMAIGVPEVGGPYGVRVDGQLLTLNSAEYVRMAWRLKQVAPAGPLKVLEIGAGYGATARRLLQMAEVKRYTIVDLPEIACLQAYYLGKCLGPDAIWLYGEEREAQVRILPPQVLGDVERPNLAFNQDSLPEIPAGAAKRYLAWIRDNLDGVFFSCNHETLVPGFAVTFVPDLIAEVGGLHRISRDLCWSRPGYVEEVYRPG
jgi:putative sugar O-methyltransferase